MKISIWKKANYLPKTKEDKVALSKLCSTPNAPETLEINTDEDLIKAITSYSWSPVVFSGVRRDENFVSCDFMTLDIDEGISIAQSEAKVQFLGLCALCLPSPSFTLENQKHRLLFPLARTITDDTVFRDTWDYLFSLFPELDQQCSDLCRFYCMSKIEEGFYQDGSMLEPVVKRVETQKQASRYSNNAVMVPVGNNIKDLVKLLYKEDKASVPECVSFFLENAHTGLQGSWINSLNSFVFSLALWGVEESAIIQAIEAVAPNPLDNRDKYQIERSLRDGYSQSKDEL